MTDETPRELVEYEPGDGPSVSERGRRRAMRLIAMIGLVALVLPGILIAVSTATATADAACRLVVVRDAPEAVGATARFELAGGEGPGWYCTAVMFGGEELLLGYLGLIPGLVDPPAREPGQQA